MREFVIWDELVDYGTRSGFYQGLFDHCHHAMAIEATPSQVKTWGLHQRQG
jgi:hypothetical protein